MRKSVIKGLTACLLLCLSLCSLSVSAQTGYICLHTKTLSEEISPTFTYTITGGSTVVAPVTLSDLPSTRKLSDVGGSHGTGGSGQIWVIAGATANTGANGLLFYRASGSSAWVSTGDSAMAVDGAGPNQCVYTNAKGYVITYNAGVLDTIYYPANHGAHKAIDVGNNASIAAGTGYTAIVDDQGYLQSYAGTYASGSDTWTNFSTANTAIPAAVARVDINVTNNMILFSLTNDKIYEISSAGTGTPTYLGAPGAATSTPPDVAFDDNGGIYALANAGTTQGDGSYNWVSGTTWKGDSSSRTMEHITGGAANEVWGVAGLVTTSGYYATIFTRTTNGSRYWYDNEWVNPGTGNSITIPVSPGTYTITETVPTNWACQAITLYDPANASTSSVSAATVTLVVSASEVVTAYYQNGLVQPTTIPAVCTYTTSQTFGTGTPTVGGPLTGLTDYHYYNTDYPLDGYYTIAKNSTSWSNNTLVDHTTGTGYFMIINASYATDEFYRQRVTGLVPGLLYSLSAYIANLSPTAAIKPNVKFEINDASSGATLGSLSSGSITNSAWQQYSFTFYATTTSADIILVNNAVGGSGNDLAIDDIAFSPIPNPIGPVTITGKDTVCQGNMTTLSDTSSGGTWSSLNTAIATVTDSGVVTGLSAGKASIVFAVTHSIGCTAADTVVVTVDPYAMASDITVNNPTICTGGTTTLTASTTTVTSPKFTWYSDAGLTHQLATGATYTTPTLSTNTTYYVTVSGTNKCVNQPGNAQSATVTVSPYPTVHPIIGPSAICTGSTASLSDTTTGGTWSSTNIPVASVNGSGLVTALSAGNTNILYTVTNAAGCTTNDTAAITINPTPATPTIAAGGATTFCAGGSVTLTATSAGASTFQWYSGGSVISGATGSTYAATVSGTYTVTASNGFGCGTPVSNSITVTVNPTPATPTVSAGGPTTFCAGDSVTLTATATGAVSYQWYLGGTAIGGATSVSYTAGAAGSYTVSITDANGCVSAMSTPATVTVNPVPSTPSASAGGPTTFCAGGSVTLSASASGASTYQWYSGGAAIGGATGATYTTSVSGSYTVIAGNGFGCTTPTSTPVVVTVNPTPATPTISAGGATTFCAGGAVTLSANAPGAATYQWYLGGTAISGATSASYSANNSGSYTVSIIDTNGCPATMSAATTVTVNPTPATPTVSAGGPTTFCAGGSVTLSATATGAASYQWFQAGTAISGATSASYSATASATYTVSITDGNGCVSPTSTATTVTVNPTPLTPTVSAGGPTAFCDGGSVVLTATASGATAYQWYQGGTAIGGATTSAYTATTSGTYTVGITDANGCTSAMSAGTTVTDNPTPATPTVTAGGPTTFCAGNNVVLTATATGASSYQWYLGGTAIGGATAQTYTATVAGNYTVSITAATGCISATSSAVTVTVNPDPTTPVITGNNSVLCGETTTLTTGSGYTSYLWNNGRTTQSVSVGGGTYTVTVTQGGCSATSGSYVVSQGAAPIPNITAGATLICNGNRTTLSVTNASSFTRFSWRLNGAVIPGANTSTYSAGTAGTYTVVGTTAFACASTSNGITITVSTPAQPTVTAGGPTTFCSGSSVVLTANASGAASYQWYNGGTAISGATFQSYTATTSGSYTVTINNAGGCTSIASTPTTVAVNPTPTTPTISTSGATTFCAGGSVTLTANTSSAASYQWYLGGTAISGATAQTLTVSASGVYTVTATSSSACTSPSSASTTVTVNPTPVTPTISAGGPTTFCAGGNVTLTAGTTGASYQWFLNGTSISGATAQSFSASASGNYSVSVTDGNGCVSATSVPTTVTVNATPATPTVSEGGPGTFCAGGSVTLTASAGGAASYQWFLNGTSISGATASTYTATASGSYTVSITDGNGCVSAASNPTTVTVNPSPATPFVTASGTTTFCAGGNVTLTANATGAASYQWFLGGTSIVGATGSTYTASASGPYTVSITDGNGCTSATSAPIGVTVNPAPGTPTVMAAGPTTFCSGGGITLSSSAPGAASYQWFMNGAAIPGAIAPSYSDTTSGVFSIAIVDANGCISAMSAGITVTSYPLPDTPTITAAGPTTFCAGGSVTLTASSTGAVSYQWYLNGVLLSTSSNATYTASTSGNYTVTGISANGCASVPSAPTTVTVNPTPLAPTVSAGGPTTFCAGGSVTLTASATGTVSYQWFLDNTSIAGATSSTYTANTTGNYTVYITDSNGCVSAMSASITVTVNPTPAVPTITAGGPTTFCAGGNVALTASATGASSYQWFMDGTSIPGATSSTYTASVSGNYTVSVTDANGCISAASAPVTVTVNPMPATPSISAGGSTTFCSGDSVLLTAASSSNGTYQWYLGGVAIAGANGQTLSVDSAGAYTVALTDGNGCVSAMSATTNTTVNPTPAPPTIATSGPTTFCAGGGVTLTASGTGNYQWFLGGVAISGATGSTYADSVSGVYSVSVTNASGCISAASAGVTVTVHPTPVAPTATAGGATTFCAGGSVTLTATGTGSYQWFVNGTSIAGATASTYNATATGVYRVSLTDGNGCVSPTSDSINVTVNPTPVTPTISAGGPTTFCASSSVTLTASGTGTYQWFLNGTSISGATSSTYTANTSGNYTVSITDANGCVSAASAAATVTVNPTPATPTITAGGPTTFCAGGSVILTANGTGSYQWFLNGASITGATTNTYTANATGSYTVSITDANGCTTAMSAATVVTVNPTPTTPTITAGGPTTFCAGGSVTLTASGTGSYQWFLNGASITGATSSTYTANASGSYTVSLTDVNGCISTASAATTVTVNPTPATPTITAGGPTTFCASGSVTLTASGTGPYQWFLNGFSITGAISNTYTANASGNYSVSITDANGCVSATSTAIAITVNPTPATPTITAGGPITFCASGSVTLTASGTGSYQWFLNGTSITGATNATYAANTSGSYTVSITDANDCTSAMSAATTVTVNPTPVTPTITAGGPTTFCASGSVTLTASGNGSYQWFLNGTSITGATNATYTANTSGSYTVSLTDANGCSSAMSAATTVTVNPTPTTPTITAGGPTTFCAGGSVTLTATGTGSYQWFLNGTSIAGATNATYTANASGTYTVSITDANGCTSAMSAATTVTVNPTPVTPTITAGGPTSFCTAGSVTLTASGTGSYQWFLNGASITGATNNTYTANASGSYTVSLTDANGCTTAMSAATTVTVNPTPVTPTITAGGPTTFCAGGSVTLTASGAGTYQWFLNGTSIPGATNATYTANADGNYSVSLTDANGCVAAMSAATTVTVNPAPVVAPIQGPGAVCIGQNITLTDATAAGTWASKTTGTATIDQNGTVTSIAPGTDTITYTVANAGGCTATAIYVVTVDALPVVPAISGATSVCQGSTTALGNTTAGGIWTSANTAVATIASDGTVTGLSAGTSLITYTVTNSGGCTASASTTVTVQTPPTAPVITDTGALNVCPGQTILLTAAETGISTFQWYVDGTAIAGATGATYTVTGPGVYTVEALNSAGCSSAPSASTTVTSICMLVPKADVAIVKQVSPGPYSIDKPISYSLTVTNNGPDNAKDVVVTDTLSQSLGEPSNFAGGPTDPTYDAATRVLQWHIPTLDSGATLLLTFDINITALGTIGNTAYVSAFTVDPDTSNNHSGVVFTIAGDIIIPNVFTPNGDGKNDQFVIVGLDRYPGSYLRIYNRWGNEVYRSENYANNWGGSGLNDGTYYYILLVNMPSGKQAYKGWVEILH